MTIEESQRIKAKMLENFGAYLKAGGLIFLTLPIRVTKKYLRYSPPRFIYSTIIARVLESGFRKKLQPKKMLIERSGIEAGMTVMELGCGPGVHTTDFAKAVGKEGKLYAVDLQQEMIDRLKRKLEKPEYKDISNVETKVASAYELPFRDESIDLVLMVGVLNEIPDKGKALKEIHRILRPDGILAISENLIDPDYPLRRTTKKYYEQSGYKIVDASGNFLNYTLRFKKAGQSDPPCILSW